MLERAGAGYIAPGDYPMEMLVIGGSQGARILSQVVPAAVAALPEGLRRHLRVAHQARAEDLAAVVAAYAEAGVRAEVEPFFTDIPRRLVRGATGDLARGCVVGGGYFGDRAARPS